MDFVPFCIQPLLLAEVKVHGGCGSGGIGQSHSRNMSYMMKTGQLLTASFMEFMRFPARADCAVCVLQLLNPLPSTANLMGHAGLLAMPGTVGALGRPCRNAVYDAFVGNRGRASGRYCRHAAFKVWNLAERQRNRKPEISLVHRAGQRPRIAFVLGWRFFHHDTGASNRCVACHPRPANFPMRHTG